MVFEKVSTALAILAVAPIGLTMISRRLPTKRPVTVLLGCFLLFGAPLIAIGLMAVTSRSFDTRYHDPSILNSATPVTFSSNRVLTNCDPYAGASVPTTAQSWIGQAQ